MSETELERMQGKHQSDKREKLKAMDVHAIVNLIDENSSQSDWHNDLKDLLIEFVIEKGYAVE